MSERVISEVGNLISFANKLLRRRRKIIVIDIYYIGLYTDEKDGHK